MNTLGAKRLELLRELVPMGATIGLLVNPSNPNFAVETNDVETAARALGHQLFVFNAGIASEIDVAFGKFSEQRLV